MNVIYGSLPVPLTLMTFFAALTFVRVPEKSFGLTAGSSLILHREH